MSLSVWPPLPEDELKKAETESLARELAWLLDSLQETLESLKSGLEECYALLAPIEPGSVLAVSSARSESVKGHITRVGSRIVKGTIQLRMKTHTPIQLSLNPTHPTILHPLVTLRTLLNQSLDCVDITRWTGDRHSASFISGQLRLLHSLLQEARSNLKGPPLITTPSDAWTAECVDHASFSPPLPDNLALSVTVQEASLVFTIRSLEPAESAPDIRSVFGGIALAIGVQRRLEHDEVEQIFKYRGQEVKVREKIRVESADPSLLAAMAKLAALEHSVGMARKCLSLVMEEEMEDP